MNGGSRSLATQGRAPAGWASAMHAAPGVPLRMARDDLRALRLGLCGVLVLAASLQLLFFWNAPDNVLTVLLALAASLAGVAYSLNTRRVRSLPVSALMLFMYTVTSTAGALLIKTVEQAPLADRLTVPVTTFAVLLATQMVLIAADQIYLRVAVFHKLRSAITRHLVHPVGVLRWPNDLELWLLGFIGCAGTLLAGNDYEGGASFGMVAAGGKIIRAFGFLKFAPFLIPFRSALSGQQRRTPFAIWPLVLYFAGLVVISFITNSRSTFADALPTIGLCILMTMALGKFDFRRIPPSRVLIWAVGAMLAGMLLSRVALAMVVVRDFRANVSPGMLVEMTFEALFNSEWLEQARSRMDSAISIGNYSEEYVNSRFFARFLLTKFHDNVMYYFSLMGPDHIASYKGFNFDRLTATLPDPALRMLGISIDKQEMLVSNGDYIVYLVDGWGLGGFKTGSMIGELFGVYGAGFPIILALCALMLFVAYDAFAVSAPDGRFVCSPMLLLLIWNLCGTTASFGFGAESVTAVPSGIVRGLPQNVLFYLIAVWSVQALTRLVGRRG